MFGGGLPVLYRTATARQKDWATVPTNLTEEYKIDLERIHYFMGGLDTRRNCGTREDMDIHENRNVNS